MSGILPPSRPKISRAEAVTLLAQHGVSVQEYPALLGLRGYYKRTMGPTLGNDVGLYDDCVCLVGPTTYAAYRFNTDPSREFPGVANLALGTWSYKLGTHHPGTPGAYECLVQAGPVTVNRDHGKTETGEFQIHIHRGGENVTSSLGCQTLPPADWPEFIAAVKQALQQAKASRLPYLLIEAP